jgi:YfiH family protein
MGLVTNNEWIEEQRAETILFRPVSLPRRVVLAVSARGATLDGDPSPTATLARRLARALGLGEIPIVRATQVHGTAARRVREAPPAGTVLDAGPCDILATTLPGIALVVQTADCVPVILAGPNAVGVAHAGWRGAAANAAGAAVEEMSRAGAPLSSLRAWLGPSIGPCCYEIGGEVAAQFAGDFARRSCNGRYTLDLRAVNRSQLGAAGIPAANISVHPACTRCGGDQFASYRRDGAAAGRMITLVAFRSNADAPSSSLSS